MVHSLKGSFLPLWLMVVSHIRAKIFCDFEISKDYSGIISACTRLYLWSIVGIGKTLVISVYTAALRTILLPKMAGTLMLATAVHTWSRI